VAIVIAQTEHRLGASVLLRKHRHFDIMQGSRRHRVEDGVRME